MRIAVGCGISDTRIVQPSGFDPTFGGALTLLSDIDFARFDRQYQDNGTSTPVTATGQPIGRIYDGVAAAGYWFQGTAGNKPTSAAFNGAKVGASFDGGDFLTSSSTTYWNTLHHATGFSIFARVSFAEGDVGAIYTLLDNNDATIAGEGTNVEVRDNGGNVGVLNCNVQVGGLSVIGAGSSNNSRSAGDKATLNWTWKYNVTGNDYRARYNGTAYSIADSARAPSTADALYALRLGHTANSGVARYWKGGIARVLIYQGDDALTYASEIEAHLASGE